LRNLAGALFRLEHDRRPHAILDLLTALVAWLSTPERAELRRAFEVMIERVLRPDAAEDAAAPTLEETRAMLETNFQRWEREWHERSEAHGRASLLLRLLERRFGSLDDATHARIEAAAPDDLLLYAERVLDAPDLDAVFAR
jgi:hypothetical protein